MPRTKEDNEELQALSKQKILMASFELFALGGYAQTTVESIAVKAGVSKGLIYHYFGGKQDILLGLVALAEQQLTDVFPPTELSGKAFLARFIDVSFDFISKRPKINRLMLALSVQPEVIQGLKSEMTRLRDEWVAMLVAVFEEMDYDNPEQEAYMVMATFDGIGLGALTFEDDYPLEKLRDAMKKRYRL